MLSFEEKKAIFLSFNLKEKKISNGRVSFVFPESKQRGEVLATQLHPSGNGYVIGKYMPEEVKKSYQLDSRGWINIRDFSSEQLKKVISDAMKSMLACDEQPVEQETVEKQLVENETENGQALREEIKQQGTENIGNIEREAPNHKAEETFPCLNNWVDFNISIMELSLLVWKRTLHKYRKISLKN